MIRQLSRVSLKSAILNWKQNKDWILGIIQPVVERQVPSSRQELLLVVEVGQDVLALHAVRQVDVARDLDIAEGLVLPEPGPGLPGHRGPDEQDGQKITWNISLIILKNRKPVQFKIHSIK